MKKIVAFIVFGIFFIISCSKSDSNGSSGIGTDPDIDNNGGSNSWSIDQSLVFDGGPGKDGIPSLENPNLLNNATEATYLLDEDLVIGLKYGNTIIAYPHRILDWHEIINTDVDDLSIAIIYCPLTGTTVGWDRNINNQKTTFGVSGLLYKNNVIPYDRATDSNWSQLTLECVNGELIGTKPIPTILPEMSWKLWKTLYPQTKVVSNNTGYSRTYDTYPYGDYKTNHQYFIFPIDGLLGNIPAKERVHSIIANNQAKVYRFSDFENGKIITDTFKGKDYIIVGNQEFIVSFERDTATSNLNFTYAFNNSETILLDNEGNTWNLFGEATSGPRKGTFLKTAKTSMMGYYFSFETFYPNVIIYN